VGCACHGIAACRRHTQIASFLDDRRSGTRAWDEKFRLVDKGVAFERDITRRSSAYRRTPRTMGSLGGADQVLTPRWVGGSAAIRRHARTTTWSIAALLSLPLPNVNVREASSLPLPVLLRHMSVLLSLASGAAAEAASFGVPALFLSNEARGPLPI